MGRRSVLIYCGNDRCQHQAKLNADRWPDDATFGELAAADDLHSLRPQGRRRPAGLGRHVQSDAAVNWDVAEI